MSGHTCVALFEITKSASLASSPAGKEHVALSSTHHHPHGTPFAIADVLLNRCADDPPP
jgi:hypothetical protein